jgi:hypothetical protein
MLRRALVPSSTDSENINDFPSGDQSICCSSVPLRRRRGIHTTFRAAKSWNHIQTFLIVGIMETRKSDLPAIGRPCWIGVVIILGELQRLFAANHGDIDAGVRCSRILKSNLAAVWRNGRRVLRPGIETKGTISPAVDDCSGVLGTSVAA